MTKKCRSFVKIYQHDCVQLTVGFKEESVAVAGLFLARRFSPLLIPLLALHYRHLELVFDRVGFSSLIAFSSHFYALVDFLVIDLLLTLSVNQPQNMLLGVTYISSLHSFLNFEPALLLKRRVELI